MAKIIMQFFIKKSLYNSCLCDAYISNDALTGGGALVGEGGEHYTTVPVCEMKGISQTRFFRKPDVCPVSEAKVRKPVLAGLRSNNEMKIFGFRRCYR